MAPDVASQLSTAGVASPTDEDVRRVTHLLRRAAFGSPISEAEAWARIGYDATVDALLDFTRGDERSLDERLNTLNIDYFNTTDLQRWWLIRMAYTTRPLQEKLTLFWHGLLVSGTNKVPVVKPTPEKPHPPQHLLNQNRMFRAHALTTVPAMLKRIARDPAMVIYLDSRDNRKAKPNENFGRELLELFTLGPNGSDGTPNYTEDDVQAVARAFTGWGLASDGSFRFNPAQHDNGGKTIFGKTGNWNGDDVIDLITAHPSHPRHFATRLYRFFVADRPTESDLQPLVNAYRTSGGDMTAIMRALFHAPAFLAPETYRAKVKTPVEFVVGMIRTLGLETNAVGLPGVLQKMGQALFNPPNVSGWPSGMRWLSTTSWLERVNFANRVVTARKDPNVSPVSFGDLVPEMSRTSAQTAINRLVRVCLDDQISLAQRQVLIDYANRSEKWPSAPPRDSDPAVDRTLRGVLYLLLALPEFQLA